MSSIIRLALLSGLFIPSANAATISLTGFSASAAGPVGGTQADSRFGFDGGTAATAQSCTSASPSFNILGSDYSVVTGTVFHTYAAPDTGFPAFNTSCYLTTNKKVSDIQIDFGTGGLTHFGFFWGSMDEYNSLSVTDVNGKPVSFGALGTVLTGASVAQKLGVPLYGSHYIDLQFASIERGAVIDFSTTSYAFEVDAFSWGRPAGVPAIIARANFASTAVPAPGGVALLAGGITALGFGRSRRR